MKFQLNLESECRNSLLKISKKLISFIMGLALVCATPLNCKAFTGYDANAYFKGINEMGNIANVVHVNGYRSALTDDLLNIYYPYPNLLYGVTDFTNKLIFVGSYQSTPFIEYTTIHEYAHALSRICNLQNNGVQAWLFQEMPNLYQYQVTYNPLNLRGTYCATSPDEYFSEAFAMYYFHPKELKAVCPMTYEYIRQVNVLFNGTVVLTE